MSARGVRAIAVMTCSAALIALAGIVYLRGPQLTAANPAPSHSAAPANLNCRPGQFELTGTFVECAAIAGSEYCPASFDQLKVIRLHGPLNDFLLYIEIDGGDHGPGMYQLRPWPHPGLSENDRIAKVAVREHDSGRLFESVAGWLTVDGPGNRGSLSAGLVENPVFARGAAGPVKLDLNLAGVWSCA